MVRKNLLLTSILLTSILLIGTVFAQEVNTTNETDQPTEPIITIPRPNTGKLQELWKRATMWVSHKLEISFREAGFNPYFWIAYFIVASIVVFIFLRFVGVDNWISWFVLLIILIIPVVMFGLIPLIMGLFR